MIPSQFTKDCAPEMCIKVMENVCLHELVRAISILRLTAIITILCLVLVFRFSLIVFQGKNERYIFM